MSSQKIRTALGLLQDDADNENAWLDLQDAMTAPDVGMSVQELAELLQARVAALLAGNQPGS